ncbi:hypothetical protein ANN_14282 [Periplaneta americana]|uniref:Uncharacterized protein n=1 Tax=Periplaneta americana TaxID=6978 RepID=A0ABQ8SVW0_PERAM|nr:hypothetical protein ANN_14282 [Periplaneta americana]
MKCTKQISSRSACCICFTYCKNAKKERICKEFHRSLSYASGKVGVATKNKLDRAINADSVYGFFCSVKVICGENLNEEFDLTLSQISSFKFAPIISCDVERSFSAYILTDKSRNFTETNLDMFRTHRHDTTVHDVIRLLIPALYKNQSDSLMAADGACHHLCKLMAPVRHRWSINDVIGGIRNTVIPSDCSPLIGYITTEYVVTGNIQRPVKKNNSKMPRTKFLKILNGEICNNDIDFEINNACVKYFKYSPTVSPEVERSFSRYKTVFSNNRQSFSFENLKTWFVIHCNNIRERE